MSADRAVQPGQVFEATNRSASVADDVRRDQGVKEIATDFAVHHAGQAGS